MVLILDGSSEIGAQMRSNLWYLNCWRHLIRSRIVTNQTQKTPKSPIFLHVCATCFEQPSYISTMGKTCNKAFSKIFLRLCNVVFLSKTTKVTSEILEMWRRHLFQKMLSHVFVIYKTFRAKLSFRVSEAVMLRDYYILIYLIMDGRVDAWT